MKSGIYYIKNEIDNKIYVGRATNLFARSINHKNALRKNEHSNKYLQNAWNKYGEDNFRFETIIRIPKIDLLLSILEIFFIVILNSHVSKRGYNISWGDDRILKFFSWIKKGNYGNGRYTLGRKNENGTSDFYGVHLSKSGKYQRWRTSMFYKGKFIHIASCDTELEAARAYDEYIIKNNLPHPLNFERKNSLLTKLLKKSIIKNKTK